MSKDDTKLMVAIHQRKSKSHSELDYTNSHRVNINGLDGYIAPWKDIGQMNDHGEVVTGGILTWVQKGTSIELPSTKVNQECMLKKRNQCSRTSLFPYSQRLHGSRDGYGLRPYKIIFSEAWRS